MKKTLSFIVTSFALLSLISCGPKKYTVTWLNFDETELEVDTKVKKGEMPQYDGATPTRETDETYVYEFAGWTPELTEVSKDVTYVATFTATPYYHVKFVNYDNTTLYEANVVQGNMPQYQGNDPVKEEDETYTYSFSGWTPEISSASEDKTYVATFTAKLIVYYHVTFVNYDDSVLYETDVREGHEAIYVGETPAKEEDSEFSYEFIGWDKDLKNVSSDITTKATFKDVPKEDWDSIIWF